MPVTLISKLNGFARTRLSGWGAAPGENAALAFPLMPNELLTAIVQQTEAGALGLPAPSTATTLKQWVPAARLPSSAPPARSARPGPRTRAPEATCAAPAVPERPGEGGQLAFQRAAL